MRLLKPMITSTMVAAVDVVVSLLPTSGLTVTEPITPATVFGCGSGLGVRRCRGMGTCGNES